MFDALLKKYNERKALRAWNKSVIGQALREHTHQYFYGEVKSLAEMSEVGKQKLIADFYSKVVSIDQAQNPLLQLREYFASYVVGFAKLQVLCLTAEEKADQFYADCPYISGQLHLHIRELSDFNEELKEVKWARENVTDAELVAFCNWRSAIFHYYMNGLNMVRVHLGDNHKTKDWFRPFLRSSLIWEEHLCRGNIGLPDLLPDSLDGLRHSTFMNMVVNGVDNPLYEWETKFKEEFSM